jgi:hypothetical protein
MALNALSRGGIRTIDDLRNVDEAISAKKIYGIDTRGIAAAKAGLRHYDRCTQKWRELGPIWA